MNSSLSLRSFSLLVLGAALSGFLALPMSVEAGPLQLRWGTGEGEIRDYKASDLHWISQIDFKNDTGTRKGFVIRNSETRDDEGKPEVGWSIVVNKKIFAETIEVRRSKTVIFLKQENSSEEYQLDLENGRILNRNKDRKKWAEQFEMTLVHIDARLG